MRNITIALVIPQLEHREAALAFKTELFTNNEYVIHGSERFDQIESYEEWLQVIHDNADKNRIQGGWVQSDTYFAIRTSDHKIVGIIDLRHTLNDFLKNFGHCGYHVRPQERRKGYASEMLWLIIQRAKAIGMKQLQLSVERNNRASIKTIQKNHGVYLRSFEFEGEYADIYQIDLSLINDDEKAEIY